MSCVFMKSSGAHDDAPQLIASDARPQRRLSLALATIMDAPAAAAKPRGRVILKMSVQLPDGQKGVIHVFPGSDPKELAEQFCDKHSLTDPKVRARTRFFHALLNSEFIPPLTFAAPPRRRAAHQR